MNTRYRLVPGVLGIKSLQFKSRMRFLFWEFDVWRYVPNSYSSRCFKERDCPIIFSFGCKSFLSDNDAYIFVKKYPNIDKWLKILYLDYKESREIVYFE